MLGDFIPKKQEAFVNAAAAASKPISCPVIDGLTLCHCFN